MEPLTAEQARTVRDYLLPSFQAEHKITHMTIQAIQPNLLSAVVPGGRSISDLLWQMVGTDHLYLTGICEARIPAMQTKPEGQDLAAILAWFDDHFKADYERVSQLSGEELLRQAEVFGRVKPVVEYLPFYLSTTIQARGLLVGYLAALKDQQASLPVAKTEHPREDGELHEQELAEVVGGTDYSNVVPNGITMVATTTIPQSTLQLLQAIQNQQTQSTFGSIMGGGFSGALAGGLSGAVLAEEVSITAASYGAAQAAEKSAVAIVQGMELAAM
jgi:hypothetical protein